MVEGDMIRLYKVDKRITGNLVVSQSIPPGSLIHTDGQNRIVSPTEGKITLIETDPNIYYRLIRHPERNNSTHLYLVGEEVVIDSGSDAIAFNPYKIERVSVIPKADYLRIYSEFNYAEQIANTLKDGIRAEADKQLAPYKEAQDMVTKLFKDNAERIKTEMNEKLSQIDSHSSLEERLLAFKAFK